MTRTPRSTCRIVGLGAGGHAGVVIDVLRLCGDFEIVGLLDPDPDLWGTARSGVEILGDDELLGDLHRRGVRHAFIGVGAARDTRPRARLYERAEADGFAVVAAFHPRAVISPSARLGGGPTVMAGAIVGPGVRLGDDVTVNTGAVVEHDGVVGAHVHVCPGAILAGEVVVGRGSIVGPGAVVAQGVRVGAGAIVGAGSVVLRDVPDRVLVAGAPAKVLRELVP